MDNEAEKTQILFLCFLHRCAVLVYFKAAV